MEKTALKLFALGFGVALAYVIGRGENTLLYSLLVLLVTTALLTWFSEPATPEIPMCEVADPRDHVYSELCSAASRYSIATNPGHRAGPIVVRVDDLGTMTATDSLEEEVGFFEANGHWPWEEPDGHEPHG